MDNWAKTLVLCGLGLVPWCGCATVSPPLETTEPIATFTAATGLHRLPPTDPAASSDGAKSIEAIQVSAETTEERLIRLIPVTDSLAGEDLPTPIPPPLRIGAKPLVETTSAGDCPEGNPCAPTSVELVDESQAQCLAAANSVLGNLLEREACVLEKCQHGGRKLQCANSLLQSVLRYQAIAERNRAASASLKVYYGLIATYEQEKVLEAIQSELKKAQQRIELVEAKGLEIPGDPAEISRQQNELSIQWEELKLRRSTLVNQLRTLLGAESYRCADLRPTSNLDVEFECLDVETAIIIALENRADLAVQRRLCCCLDEDTLPAIRAVMQATNGLLGSQLSSSKLCGIGFRWWRNRIAAKRDLCELNLRRGQVCQQMEDQQREIEQEICQAAFAIEVRRNQLQLSLQNVAAWSNSIEHITVQQMTEDATVFAKTEAVIGKLQAETVVVNHALQLKIAEVDFRSAQGLLAVECGYCVADLQCGPGNH